MYCLDTDVLSALIRPAPPAHLRRRLAALPPTEQCTTSVTLGELVYGAVRHDDARLAQRVEGLIRSAGAVLPFDEPAARIYARIRAELETHGRKLDEPDLRIAAIALSRDLTLITGNVRHFARVPDLRVENWLEPG
ncbi:MAG: PIN domain-containing protein [Thermoleophilaceae bacterium]